MRLLAAVTIIAFSFSLAACNQQQYGPLTLNTKSPQVSTSSPTSKTSSTATSTPSVTSFPTKTAAPDVSMSPNPSLKPGTTPEPTVASNTTPKPSSKPTTKPSSKPTSKPSSKPTPKATPKPTPKPTPLPQPQIMINEIMGSNRSTIADERGNFEDWIELYNASNFAVNLQNYYLSDGNTNLLKWQFPSVTIPAKGHLLVWASNKNYLQANGQPHTNFRLKIAGENITLLMPDGKTVLDVRSATSYTTDISYGRKQSGSNEWQYFGVPTPGQPNS
ncbi:MAG: lamin tail domain-containing protein [Bacillota bacterium]